jgi:flagellar basal-body rod protein FlgF
MLSGLYSAAAGMDAATTRHEVAAKNLAFAQHPGHRRLAFRQSSFGSHLGEAGGNLTPTGPMTEALPSEQVDFSPGRLELTGRTLDVALEGEGFLVLEGPQGPLYTRNGRLHVNAAGELVSGDGWRVQGRGGTITFPPGTSTQNLQITSSGQWIASGIPLGQLEIVTFADPARLQRVGAAVFAAPEGVIPEPVESTVIQGMFEHSNVEPVSELVALIVAARQYEAAQQAMRSIERAVERHIHPR